ncbi:MAG: helix-turn-helix transcriptional regulator [Gordonia sp. (in: high G+C Gram-positive bacteria)]
MNKVDAGERMCRAIADAGISQRDIAAATGISQATLSRIVSGERAAKLPELLLVADATGVPLGRLTGSSVGDRVQSAACADSGYSMVQVRDTLVMYLELDAYLTDQVIT